MPVTKSAKKKLRQDKKKELRNSKIEDLVKKSLKKVQKKPSQDAFTNAVKNIDKAAQKNVISKNKAARIKSKLAKLINNKKNPSSVSKTKATKIKK